MKPKLRVWWLPQIGASDPFYIPIDSLTDGVKLLEILAGYDAFQFHNNIKPDYSNAGGIEMYDETTQEWCDWEAEINGIYYNDIQEYCNEYNITPQIQNLHNILFQQIS